MMCSGKMKPANPNAEPFDYSILEGVTLLYMTILWDNDKQQLLEKRCRQFAAVLANPPVLVYRPLVVVLLSFCRCPAWQA